MPSGNIALRFKIYHWKYFVKIKMFYKCWALFLLQSSQLIFLENTCIFKLVFVGQTLQTMVTYHWPLSYISGTCRKLTALTLVWLPTPFSYHSQHVLIPASMKPRKPISSLTKCSFPRNLVCSPVKPTAFHRRGWNQQTSPSYSIFRCLCCMILEKTLESVYSLVGFWRHDWWRRGCVSEFLHPAFGLSWDKSTLKSSEGSLWGLALR